MKTLEQRVQILEKDLIETREQLKATNQELKATNQELKTTTTVAYEALEKVQEQGEVILIQEAKISKLERLGDFCKLFYNDIKDMVTSVSGAKAKAVNRVIKAAQQEPELED